MKGRDLFTLMQGERTVKVIYKARTGTEIASDTEASLEH